MRAPGGDEPKGNSAPGARERPPDRVERHRGSRGSTGRRDPRRAPPRGSPAGRSWRCASSGARGRRPPSRAGTTGRGGRPPRSGGLVARPASASAPGLTTTKHQIASPLSGAARRSRPTPRPPGARRARSRPRPARGACRRRTACRRSARGGTRTRPRRRVAQSPWTQTPGNRRQYVSRYRSGVAPDPARHRRPGLPAHELPHLARARPARPSASTMSTSIPSAGPRSVHGFSSRDRQRREEAGADLGAAATG